MKLEPRAIPDYVRIDRRGTSALVHPEFAVALSPAIFDGEGLRPTGYVGRSAIQSVDTPNGTVLIRQCRRGGALRNILRDKYLLHNRPRAELSVHREAYRLGVATVLPVAVVWKRTGPLFSGSIATLQVEATDLRRRMSEEGGVSPAELAACGRAIWSMHAAGIVHADLNTMNLLVRGDEAWVIDFDKSHIVTEVGRLHARDNFLRLRRSMLKHGVVLHFDSIVEAYEAAGGVKIPL